MNHPLQIFKYEEAQMRTIVKDGEPWFVAADVCVVLGVGNPTMAINRLDDDERTLITVEGASNGLQINAVNESGLYSLIMTSRKPEAKKFKKWVTAEVLPAIRKTGSYVPAQLDTPEQRFAHAILDAQLIIEKKDNMIAQRDHLISLISPKATALDRISTAEGSMCITDAAKSLQIQPKKLFAYLQAEQWIFRRAGGSNWIAYQPRIQSGILEHKTTAVTRTDGTEKITEQVRITPKGLTKLALELESREAA